MDAVACAPQLTGTLLPVVELLRDETPVEARVHAALGATKADHDAGQGSHAGICAASDNVDNDGCGARSGGGSRCSGNGGSSISRHQLLAFATLVDEVYETYGVEGSDGGGKQRPRRHLRQQPSVPESLCHAGEVVAVGTSAPDPHQPLGPALADVVLGPMSPPTVAISICRRWLGPGSGTGMGGGRHAAAAAALLPHNPPGTSARDSADASGCSRTWRLPPSVAPSVAAAFRHGPIRAQLQAPPLPQLSALPNLLLTRRWTDGAAAVAAAAAGVGFTLAAPHRPGQHPPSLEPEAPPCRLLELPNELLLLITLSCVAPGGSAACQDAAASRPRTGATPRAAPSSPGWSFALIASPITSPNRATARGRASRGGAGRASGGGADGDGGLAGLRVVACAAMTCRRLRGAYRLLLAARPDLELQAEAALRSLHEKRRLVRRLTITQHDAYVARELAAEGAAGVAVAAAVALLCGAFGACTPNGGGLVAYQLTNYIVFTAVHVLLHTAILAAAYRISAWMGTRRSLALGLAGLTAHYVLLVPAVKVLLALPPVPPHLNLEPWHRRPTDPPPSYVLAALLWPLYGDGMHWRLIHLLSNGFAWAYGTYEWHHSFSQVRLRNGLRY